MSRWWLQSTDPACGAFLLCRPSGPALGEYPRSQFYYQVQLFGFPCSHGCDGSIFQGKQIFSPCWARGIVTLSLFPSSGFLYLNCCARPSFNGFERGDFLCFFQGWSHHPSWFQICSGFRCWRLEVLLKWNSRENCSQVLIACSQGVKMTPDNHSATKGHALTAACTWTTLCVQIECAGEPWLLLIFSDMGQHGPRFKVKGKGTEQT